MICFGLILDSSLAVSSVLGSGSGSGSCSGSGSGSVVFLISMISDLREMVNCSREMKA